jgi:hypothetical protein
MGHLDEGQPHISVAEEQLVALSDVPSSEPGSETASGWAVVNFVSSFWRFNGKLTIIMIVINTDYHLLSIIDYYRYTIIIYHLLSNMQ